MKKVLFALLAVTALLCVDLHNKRAIRRLENEIVDLREYAEQVCAENRAMAIDLNNLIMTVNDFP